MRRVASRTRSGLLERLSPALTQARYASSTCCHLFLRSCRIRLFIVVVALLLTCVVLRCGCRAVGRPHNCRPGWVTLGNQLDGVRLHDPVYQAVRSPFCQRAVRSITLFCLRRWVVWRDTTLVPEKAIPAGVRAAAGSHCAGRGWVSGRA